MIQPQKMENRGLQIMDRNLITYDLETKLVRFPIHGPGFHTTPCHEHGKAIRIVVTSQGFAVRRTALAKRSTSKFSAPDHQGLIQEATLFKVTNQCRHRPVHGGRLDA